MPDEQSLPNTKRLWTIAFISGAIAVLGASAFFFQISAYTTLNWVWWLIIGTLTMILYGIAFYFGVILFENTLEKYIASDTFKRKHKWIDVETETRPAETAKLDGWVSHYVFARTMLAMGILPVIACIYLFFFA